MNEGTKNRAMAVRAQREKAIQIRREVWRWLTVGGVDEGDGLIRLGSRVRNDFSRSLSPSLYEKEPAEGIVQKN